jgi:hypothetical protein
MPPGGCFFRGSVSSGPWVQIRRNSGAFQRWQGDPSHPWYPDYGLLVFVHGPAPESVAQQFRRVFGLSFLEKKETMRKTRMSPRLRRSPWEKLNGNCP